MKNLIISLSFFLMALGLNAQNDVTNTTKKHKIGWFVTPEYSSMFLKDHIGHAVGFSMGLKLFNDHLKVGYYNYARSGPINSHTINTPLPDGKTYKGKSSVDLRADHGAFGLMIAPSFTLRKSNIEIDFPIYIGSIGAGFYLSGDDRKTPDNRRVSDWENDLFDGKDAAFAGMTEFGVRAFVPTKINGLHWGVGLHYLTVQDWTTFLDPSGDFYNNKFRASVFVNFGSKQRN
ncbi:MAG: hypothetical protein EAY81_09315 [Bacteroidetes bacterium]|nr:MAG: hypothetical protein EAY81_09315 [Bacteroidota bacterium]